MPPTSVPSTLPTQLPTQSPTVLPSAHAIAEPGAHDAPYLGAFNPALPAPKLLALRIAFCRPFESAHALTQPAAYHRSHGGTVRS